MTVRDEVLEIADRMGKVLDRSAPDVILRALREIEALWKAPASDRTLPKMIEVLDVEASKQSTPLPPAPVVYPPVPPRGAVLNERPKDPRKTPSATDAGGAPAPRERVKLIRKGLDGTKQG